MPLAQRHPLAGRDSGQTVGVDPLLAVFEQSQLGVQRIQDLFEIDRIHLDMDGADGRAIGHHAYINAEMLDRVVRQHGDAVVGADAACFEELCDAVGDIAEFAIGDRFFLIDTLDKDLVGVAVCVCCDPVPEVRLLRAHLRSRADSRLAHSCNASFPAICVGFSRHS